MIRSELVQHLCEAHPDLSPREVESIVGCFFDTIAARLAANGRVELRGFGAFRVQARAARTGRNPSTGEAVEVPARRAPVFRPARELRLAVEAAA